MTWTATVSAKVAKQIAYQRNLSQTGDPHYRGEQVIIVEHMAELVAQQTRRPVKSVIPDVKAELEALVAEGTLQRWLERYEHSHIRARADEYVILEVPKGRADSTISAV